MSLVLQNCGSTQTARRSAESSLFCSSGGPAESAVEQSLTGARIRLLRNGAEIADGAAPIVHLRFPLVFATGYQITAVQQLGTCQGIRGFQIVAVPASEP